MTLNPLPITTQRVAQQDKPFSIPKRMVWEAWRRVKANKGAPGVDGEALAEFEADLENNLYKIWNVRNEC